jgi:ABC-type multidrug transport system fused ATPase/permease subunit
VCFFPCARELAKAVQSELAEANSVAEEALSSMTTVRAFAAEDSARAAYDKRLRSFYMLQVRASSLVMTGQIGRLPASWLWQGENPLSWAPFSTLPEGCLRFYCAGLWMGTWMGT